MTTISPLAPSGAAPVGGFNHRIDDLLYWVFKRRDGTVIKYIYTPNTLPTGSGSVPGFTSGTPTTYVTTLTSWCKHTPDVPIFQAVGKPVGKDPAPEIELFVCDADDIKKNRYRYDLIIDAGQVLFPEVQTLSGDSGLEKVLNQHVIRYHAPKLLKMFWADRQAPDVEPAFWPALVGEIWKLASEVGGAYRVATNCQGGHGRSGTAAVAIMMCLTDYTPKDAIIHLRALHCPRAIESDAQHKYLDTLAEYLGREKNAKQAEEVSDYRKAFLTSENPTAKRFRSLVEEREKGEKGE